MRPVLAVTIAAVIGLSTSPASSQTQAERLRSLERAVEEMRQREHQRERLIRELQSELVVARQTGRTQPAAPTAPAASASQAHDHSHGVGDGTDVYATDLGGGAILRLKAIGAAVSAAAGGSSESGGRLEALQGGDHDPRQNGFTLQSADLFIRGGVDPYFDAQANIAFFIDPEGETVVELEEAFLRSQNLPFGLEVKAGQFFTEFGAYNPTHFHDHHWLDQPVVLTRFFGPDGLRNPGARVAWTAPFTGPRWKSTVIVGAQNAHGETAASFLSSDELAEERPTGGRPFLERGRNGLDELLYHARLGNSFTLAPATSLSFGISGLAGPNYTGKGANTYVYGADVNLHRDFSAGRYLDVTAEVLRRHFEAATNADAGIAGGNLRDWGLYAQTLYGFAPRFAAGLRYEYATGKGDSVGGFASRKDDPFRSDRHRVSPLLEWQFSPLARVGLQYNYDHADFLEKKDAHSVWLGLKWTFGAGDLTGHGHAGHHH